MTHLGDITKINGAAAPPVNVVIGGSPCQDLSIAGKRAGLAGERSGLFMEQIRIIKEMRENDRRAGRSDEFARPRFMVWENVPGAFSSNKGEDFRAVLEETARVVDKAAVIPRPPKGKWSTSGAIVGDGWSVAWRVLDAQFWGVPQRRRRIALIADFGGKSAPEILFERQGVCGDSSESGAQRKGTAADSENGVDSADLQRVLAFHLTQDPISGDVAPCLSSGNPATGQCMCGIVYNEETITSPANASNPKIGDSCHTLTGKGRSILCVTARPVICIQGNCIDRADTAGCNGKGWTEDVCYTLNTIDRPAVAYGFKNNMSAKTYGVGFEADVAPTLAAGQHDASVVYSVDRAAFNQGENAKYDFEISESGTTSTLVSRGPSAVAYSFDSLASNSMKSKNPHSGCREVDIAKTIDTTYPDPSKNQGGIAIVQRIISWIVRRLTPLECERLQGFPDGWTDIGDWTDSKGKIHKSSDSARYKALGNSIALPPWAWILSRLSEHCGEDKTMASLFDGIGGFPLIWERLNGAGSCLWASEIEEFPITVTKHRFGGGVQ